jgi:hypothetical protein
MADIQIAITAKNTASAAVTQVNADLAGLAKQAAATGAAMVSIGKTQFSLGAGSTALRDMTQDLQNATQEALRLKTAISAPTQLRNAGGLENVTASIKLAEAELDKLLKQYQQLAQAGKLDFGAGSTANLSQAQTAIAQQVATLNRLRSAAVEASKAGVLGDGSGPARNINEIARTSQLLTQSLRSVETQAGKASNAVSNVGKGTNLSGLKSQVSDIDKSFGSLAGALSGGFGGVAGFIGLGATALAIGQIGSSITEAVVAADQLGKLRASFDQLATSAGQSGDEMLNALRTASSGMISDANLIQSANKAMLLGVADSAEEMTGLLEVARVRGQAMGLSVTDAFNDIVTGLGRESALILDNLGITIDLDRTYKEYAATLGKTVGQLDAVERKQALVNKVMQESKGLSAPPPTGAGAALGQASAASANAQASAGEFFAPLVRDSAQAYGDAIALATGKLDQATIAQRELNDAIADGQIVNSVGNVIKLDEADIRGFQELAVALQDADRALAAGIPTAQMHKDNLIAIATVAKATGQITAQQAADIQIATAGLKENTEQLEKYTAAQARANVEAQKAGPYYQQLVDQNRQVAIEEANAANQAQILASAFGAAQLQAQLMAGGLSQVQAQAGATAGIIYNLIPAMQQLNAASNKNLSAPDALDRVIPQIGNVGGGLVDNLGLDGAIAKTNELKIQNRELAESLKDQGYTEDEIYLALSANVQETQRWASSLDGVSEAATKAKEQFDNIQGKVAGLISEAQNLPSFKAGDLFNADELTAKGLSFDSQIGVDQAANGGIRPDAINENARRLMAIAKEGLTDQSWLEEFKREVPAVFAELEGNPDIRGSALRILQEFQNGLRPELLDRGAIKERVKQLIIGDQSAAALANEIAQEIAGEMGISLQQAMSAASSALGLSSDSAGGEGVVAPDLTAQGNESGASLRAGMLAGFDAASMTAPGNEAGISLRAGMIAGFDANGMTAAIVVKINDEFGNPKSIEALKKSGGAAGAQWGNGFLTGVGDNVPPGLVEILVTKVVPFVIAAYAKQGTQTGAAG